MFDARSPSHKAKRFATVDDVSDQIFDTISPQDTPENTQDVDRSRIRTRLLDFNFFRRPVGEEDLAQPKDNHCAYCSQNRDHTVDCDKTQSIFGWLVIVEGPGRGQSFPLSKEVTSIGRGADLDVCLDFGDTYISRSAHVTVHLDRERNLVAVRFENRRNPVSLDGKVLSGTRLLKHKSRLTIGQTLLRFVQIDDHEAFWSA